MDVAEVIARAKGSSSISVRALAASAGVAGSTITRIQSGTVDPTVQTVDQILEAAGFELRLSVVRRDALLAGAAEKLADDAGLARPSWATAVPAVDPPYRPPVRAGVELEVPSQLAERGLLIDTTSLWRDRRTVGV